MTNRNSSNDLNLDDVRPVFEGPAATEEDRKVFLEALGIAPDAEKSAGEKHG